MEESKVYELSFLTEQGCAFSLFGDEQEMLDGYTQFGQADYESEVEVIGFSDADRKLDMRVTVSMDAVKARCLRRIK